MPFLSVSHRHLQLRCMTETAIEWTDSTWNPVAGCSVMSAGCSNCYAMLMARRLEAMGVKKYKGLTQKTGSRTVWTGEVHEDYGSLGIPIRWKKPRKIFVNSMSDLFHPSVSSDFIAQVWSVMEQTPRHNYQILTKRPDRMAELLISGQLAKLPNVWLGTSVENKNVVHRISALRKMPASIKFISFEPLIGPIGSINLSGIDWAIVGGESGPKARPIREKWVDEIHDSCRHYDTAFFFKQWGAWGKDNKRRSKKLNGRTYRGKTWDEMPIVRSVSDSVSLVMVKKIQKWEDGIKLEEHSRRKHKILHDYFRRYLLERCKNPLSRGFRLAIIDGFAGGGEYENGSPGSPVIFADTLFKTVAEINYLRSDHMPTLKVDCLLILNDADKEAVQSLQKIVRPFREQSNDETNNVKLEIQIHHGKFEESVDKFCTLLKKMRYRNVIYNLDQYGHSCVSQETIHRLVHSEKSVEVFLTYAIDALLAFLSKKKPEIYRKQLARLSLPSAKLEFTNELMSKVEWLGSIERNVFDYFYKCSSYVSPFSINNPKGWRYWFMHFAKNYRARQIYNDVLHDNSNALAHFGRAGLNMLSYEPKSESCLLHHFDKVAREKALDQLPDDIARLVSDGGDIISISEFYHSIYNETPAHSDDIHFAIFANHDLEILTPSGNQRRSPHTISLEDFLRLKKQMSFFLPNKSKDKKE